MTDRRLVEITERIAMRSAPARRAYLDRIEKARQRGPQRAGMSCTNLAHAFAASGDDKDALFSQRGANIAMVSAYNDMLSAHQPLAAFPALLQSGARKAGATAQYAGGVPAMCDGVTQGNEGMELSLFSRDVIAMSTAVALSHNVFDAVACLGVCDKIVPGLLMGALAFGQLPCVFVPAGPMTSGLSNGEKARIRQEFAEGKATREELLKAESAAYHGPGTCTFYGTANSNQMLMEVMGLHLPGAAFANPATKLRSALTEAAGERLAQMQDAPGVGQMIDERSIVNALVGLNATGGSTNHTLHIVAIARAAGITVNWDDFDAVSRIVPSLTRIYPNGSADVNHFHAAGGMGLVIRELLEVGLLHESVETVMGTGLSAYAREPFLDDNEQLRWQEAPAHSLDDSIVRSAQAPFAPEGGLKVLRGNLGRSVIKVSAVAEEHQIVQAPVRIFHDQASFKNAFEQDQFQDDVVVVVRFQGPSVNGMPELHKLTPYLCILQDRGLKVALVTDGRMSGASGRVPAAIHVSPEAARDGMLARLRDGDIVRLDATQGQLEALVDAEVLAQRSPASIDPSDYETDYGRELFGNFRHMVSDAESGAISIYSGEQASL